MNENKKKQDNKISFLFICIFFIFMFILLIWEMKKNYVIAYGDTTFHINRIYQIRLAFLKHQIPNWLNFSTFYHAGYAINGMYPDITLWPYVFITNFLSPIKQVICIRFLIDITTFLITTLSMYYNKYNKVISVMVGIIYSLSGYLLYTFVNELELGTSIVAAFAFPIFFMAYKLININSVEIKSSLKMGILFAIVLCSHLLSCLAIAIIIIPIILLKLIKHNYYPIINFLFAGFTAFLLGLPIFYRYLIISKTNILPPYNQGNLNAEPFINLFTGTSWATKVALSLPSIFFLVSLFIFFNKQKEKKLITLIILELYIALLCSKLIPLELMDKIPLINNFQYMPWRFAFLLGIIPFILFIENFKLKTVKKILTSMSALSFIFTLSTIGNIQHNNNMLETVTNKTQNIIPNSLCYKLTSSGIGSNTILRQLIPDYAPSSVGSQTIKDNVGCELSPFGNYLIANQLVLNNNHFKPVQIIPITNQGVIIKTVKLYKGLITLPIFDYTSLHYHVYINHKNIKYYSYNGFITIHINKNQKNIKIKIVHSNPKFYKYILIFSFIFLILILISINLIKI